MYSSKMSLVKISYETAKSEAHPEVTRAKPSEMVEKLFPKSKTKSDTRALP